MLLYMQELRSRAENPDAALRKRLDSTMVSCLLDARYLLPHKNTQLLMLLNSSTGKKLIPLFTDLIEFSRFSSRFSGGKDLKLVTADFGGLSKMELPGEADGFLINPSTSAVPLPADYIRKLSQRIEDVRKELNNKTKI